MKHFCMLMLGLGCFTAAQAQIRLGDGQLTGSFESNSIYYVDDSKFDKTSTDRFGSNNYLKIDYTYGKFSAGIQGDAFLPVLQGYDDLADGYKFYLSSKYVQWQDKNFEVLVGDIFDQLGNGLIFRSYEDRQLGLNNSLEGVRGIYRFSNYVRVKGMYGRPRLYTKYADSWVRALDLQVSMNDIFGWDKVMWAIEGSYVNRYQSLDKDENIDFSELGLTTPNLNMYSGRMNFDWNGLSLRGEYVTKSKDVSMETLKAATGSAIQAEIGYHYKSFSFAGTFRQLDHMGTEVSLYGKGLGNTLNYLPALTRQYTYMLANLNPYQVVSKGERGGQIDLYYSLRSSQDRYRYWNFHANFSTFYTLRAEQTQSGKRNNLTWRDIDFDVERQWDKKWKTTLLFSRQEWSPSKGFQDEMYVSNIFVADVTHKFTPKKSLRFEVQYLLSDDYEGDWVAGLVEFSIAPRWSFFVSDMYNLGTTDTNYYNGGFSYTRNRTRVQISYGRNREGYICSGGVCRLSPAYTGVNLMLTSSF